MIEDDEYYRVISIDPGTVLMGVTLWEIHIPTLTLRIVACWTEALQYHEKNIPRELDNLELRLLGLRQTLTRLFKRFKPHAVCTESNFLQKKRVTGYRALLLTIAATRNALHDYCAYLELDIVHLIKAKEFMKAASNSKEDVHKKVIAIGDVVYPEDFNPRLIGPDGLDSIALGYCFIKSHWDQLQYAQHWFNANK